MARWLVALVLAVASVVEAVPVSFSGSGGVINLPGGGDTSWIVVPDFGTSDGTPTGTCNETGNGLAVADAMFDVNGDAEGNAFDNGLTVWVNDQLFTTPDTVDVTGSTLTAGPTTMSGVEVTVQHAALASGPILRTLVGVRNPAATTAEVDVKVITNLGSDADTGERGAGDDASWIVTSDDPATPTDLVVVTAYGGWAGPDGFGYPNVGISRDTDAFECSGTQGVVLTESGLSVPPFAEVFLLFFTQLDDDNAGGIAAGASFEMDLAASLLEGLDEATQLRILNYYVPGEVKLVGGGPGGGSRWYIHNQSLPSSGAPVGGKCAYGPGLSIVDAELDPAGINRRDAYDNGRLLFVGPEAFAASLSPTVTASSYAGGPHLAGGLDTSVVYEALPGSATLRTLARFTNPGFEPVSTTVTVATNMGSDGTTGVRGSSSGDTTFDVADRWVVTSDDDEEPSDPVITHVLAGGGTVPVPPSAVSSDVFECATSNGILVELPLTIPAGETRALLFFDELSTTNDGAVTAAARFDATPATSDPLLAGIPTSQLPEVVNWAFCAAQPSLCDDGDACTVDACGATGGCNRTALPATADFLSIGCRLGELLADAQALPEGKIRTAVVAKLDAARAAITAAQSAEGRARKKQLRKAGKALKAAEKRLRSKPAKKAIDAAVRDDLIARSTTLRTDLKTVQAAGV